jgi:hypothetical protein
MIKMKKIAVKIKNWKRMPFLVIDWCTGIPVPVTITKL